MNLFPAKHPLAFRPLVPTMHILLLHGSGNLPVSYTTVSTMNMSKGTPPNGKTGHRHPPHPSHAEGPKGNLSKGKIGHPNPSQPSHAEGPQGNLSKGEMGHPHPSYPSPHRNIFSNSSPICLS